jgi:hypothetical protein
MHTLVPDKQPIPPLLALIGSIAFLHGAAQAQSTGGAQAVKPPVAQLWMDVATFTMPGMPEMPGLPAMGALGGLFGSPGSAAGATFGNTRSMAPGRWVDIALVTQRKPAGTEATQAVPPGTGLAPSLALHPPGQQRATPAPAAGSLDEPERPRGRISFYWGCGETVRPGQPRVLDFSKAGAQEWGSFMQGRAVRERGAQARPGHAVWPNEQDARRLGRDASIAGEHAVSGDGVPAGLKFEITKANDLMPAIALSQAGAVADVLRLSWAPVDNARAYFMNAMGGGGAAGGGGEMVFWSSAELPEFGMGLMDYASPANIERWLREKVLLPASASQCAIPKGIFAKADGAMLRMIAYGPELNLAFPPRPTDAKVAWAPEWAVRVRTKSAAIMPLGDQAMSRQAGQARQESVQQNPTESARPPSALDMLRGVLGR